MRSTPDDPFAERLLTEPVRVLLAERYQADEEYDWWSWPQVFGTTAGPWEGYGGAALTTFQVSVARGTRFGVTLVFVDEALFAHANVIDARFWHQVAARDLQIEGLGELGLTVLREPLHAARPERPGWDEWALGLATAVAARADCTRRQVGAVLLDPDHRVVGAGYNGYPSGQPGCLSNGACPRGRLGYDQVPAGAPYTAGDGLCGAIHAEENAVAWADRAVRAGATLYVTDEPCPNCQRFLTGAGIAAVVWPGGRISYGPPVRRSE